MFTVGEFAVVDRNHHARLGLTRLRSIEKNNEKESVRPLYSVYCLRSSAVLLLFIRLLLHQWCRRGSETRLESSQCAQSQVIGASHKSE